MGPFDCVIIEDNFIDRKLLEAYLSAYSFLRVAGSFTHPLESAELLKTGQVSILFSDIDMPVMNGVDFFKTLKDPPLCIFTTVHPEFALEAFDVQAVDYVLKPIKPDRLDKAIQRALELLEVKSKALQYELRFEQDYLMIKEGTTTNKISVSDIIYLEALANYTKVITYEKKFMTLHNLKSFLECLPSKSFMRIHRSYAVAVDKIRRIDRNELLVEEKLLPLGKTYRHEIRKFAGSAF